MENKKYLDKVIESLVRGTKIDYEKGIIFFPLSFLSFSPFSHLPFYLPDVSSYLSSYCKNTFGLTEEEIEYVIIQWRVIILDKINNGE